jgi:hypothetical protein
MKHLKMLGLAAIAALGLMAFVGAGTASATTLSTDAAGNTHYGPGTVIHSTLKPGTSALLKDTSGGTIATCTESTTKGKLEDPVVETNGVKFVSGTWVTGALETLTWGGCSQTTDTLANGSLEIMWTSGNSGEVRSKGSKVTLGVFGVSCVYGTGEGTVLGTITGGTAPELAINAKLAKVEGGFLCPSSGVWTANYIVTEPHALFVVN